MNIAVTNLCNLLKSLTVIKILKQMLGPKGRLNYGPEHASQCENYQVYDTIPDTNDKSDLMRIDNMYKRKKRH